MKTEKYLGQIERYNRMIEFKVNELNTLREMAVVVKSATSDDMKIQSGSPQNKLENVCIDIVDKEQELQDLISRFFKAKAKIISEIEQLDNTNEYTVLIMRYVECRRMKEIADKLNYSVKNIERIHTNAIKNFTEIHGANKDFCC
jgi:DNA-directed RNA polymerase specialized sigma subunit